MSLDDSSICRLCGENSLPSIYNAFTVEGLVELVYKYLSIKIIPEDVLPSYICGYCKRKVESFDEFALKCKDVQDILQTDKKYATDGYFVLNKDLRNDENVEIKVEEDDSDLGIKTDLDFYDEDILPLSACLTNIKKEDEDKRNRKLKKKSYNNQTTVKQKRKRKDRNDKNYSKKKIKSKLINDGDNVLDINRKKDEALDPNNDDKSESRIKSINEKTISDIKYNCHVCSEIFENWYKLAGHVESVHFARTRIICVCKKPLYSINAVNLHIRKHGKKICYSCDMCDKVFLIKKNFERHISKHSDDGKSDSQFECKKCSLVLTSAKRFDQHQLKHKKQSEKNVNIKCEICDKVYATEQSLRYHKAAVHEKVKPFICDICGHAFHQKNNLVNHRLVHSERTAMHCEFCPRKFINKRYLQRHLLCHSGVSYKCSVCPAVFNYKNTLNNHMLIHQNLNKFVCGFCNKGFKWQSSLKTHINIHTGATPYSCPWCSRTFSDRSNCRLHKKKHHPRELAEYEQKNGIVHLGKTPQFNKKDASVIPLKDPKKIKVVVYPMVDQMVCNGE